MTRIRMIGTMRSKTADDVNVPVAILRSRDSDDEEDLPSMASLLPLSLV